MNSADGIENPATATVCEILNAGIKNCTDVSLPMFKKLHQCFSKQEIELMRDLAATIHTMAMKDLNRLNKKFGKFAMAHIAFATSIFQVKSPSKREMEELTNSTRRMDVSVDDFRDGSVCQTTLMEYSMVSNSPQVLPLLSMIYFTASLSILLSKL